MHPSSLKTLAFLSLALLMTNETAFSQRAPLGLFENHSDVGDVQHPGSVEYDAEAGTYLVTGSGENMWFDTDAFHYVWKMASGDVSLASDIRIVTEGGNPHRKAVLMIRQSLEPDAAYADVVVHGDGLTSIQYREERGGPTREVQANVTEAPQRIRIQKEGDFVSMSIANEGEALHATGGTFKLPLKEPFFVGLGVCAHDNDAIAQALFSNVVLTHGTEPPTGDQVLESTLEVVPIASGDRRVLYHTRGHIEAPNWSPDGTYLLYNSEGRLYKLPVEGGEPQMLNTGFATRANNDHGISPDGKTLIISHNTQEHGSMIYTLPIDGGTPRQITEQGPSYWHGISPDGKTLAFVGRRNDDYDIYTIPIEGGEETRLTTAPGLDDGPDYSPDGRYIYFNSVRTGTMQIYRMKADGSDVEQLTSDAYNDWFPHPSPDGRWIVFLSYEPDVEGHPANKDVMLRLMPVDGGEIQVLAKLFGGQGTINVPSWSPDSERVAFVSYRLTNP